MSSGGIGGGVGTPPPPPSLVESLFQRSLDDVIRSLRSSSSSSSGGGGEASLVSRFLDEIRREVRHSDPSTKSIAISKLFYLSSIYFTNPSFAAFNNLELLPSPSFSHKLTAYRSAAYTLNLCPDLLLLAVNLLRKDLSIPSIDPIHTLIPSLPLHFISLAATPDLARNISADVIKLLTSPRHSLCAKALAATLKVISLSPNDSAESAIPRLIENLNSDDPKLVSVSVSVFCELVAKDAISYLPLAPDFHRILTASHNNWVLIKILKILSNLVRIELRLARRIVDPICDLLASSNAKSVVYECVRAVATGLCSFDRAMKLSVSKVQEFLTANDDPNLRFLGLHALSLLSGNHPWAVEENKEVVIRSLVDPDPNIRHEALKLLMGLVTENNVIELSTLLVGYAKKSDPEFCNEILRMVLETCGRNVYELVTDFDWYVFLLCDMARVHHCDNGEEIERQLVDIGLRVKDARPELANVARDLLIDPALLGNPMLSRILSAAAWISGEYVEFSRNTVELVEALLQPKITLLPALVRSIYVQAVFKVLAFSFNTYVEQMEADKISSYEYCEDVKEKKGPSIHESIVYMIKLIETAVGPLTESDEVEVLVRARNVLALVQTLKEIGIENSVEKWNVDDYKVNEVVKTLQDTFSEDLGPVSEHAQERVAALHEGITLEENLSGLDEHLGGYEVPAASFSLRRGRNVEVKREITPLVESSSLLAEHRKRHGLYYLPRDTDEVASNDYPRANEPRLSVGLADASEDLVKLTDQSLLPRIAKKTKPRPVVIKLNEVDALPLASTPKPLKEANGDLLSGAVRELLLENKGETGHSQVRSSASSSQRTSKEKALASDSLSLSKGTLQSLAIDPANPSKRKSRKHHHAKGRSRNLREEVKEELRDRKSLRSNRHNENQNKNSAVPLNLAPQAPVIQDFLL